MKSIDLTPADIKETKDINWRKCGLCGRFISYKQMENKEAVFHYTPDTDFTSEEMYWTHKNCKAR